MKILALLIAITGLVFPQSDRTIEVTGTGTFRTMPDLGILMIEASVISEKFGDVVKEINAKTEKLTAQLQMIGFKKDEIKTADFSVAKNIVWENNSNVEKGYVARQSISVEFPHSKEKIGTIISSFMGSDHAVRFSFSFTLSEKKETMVKDEVLKRAVRDARSRAEVIAAAAQQKIGAVKRISYGSASPQPMAQTAMYKTMAAGNEQSSGFDVKEISFSDEVTIIWDLQ
jgi:uncharacterized protein YggE